MVNRQLKKQFNDIKNWYLSSPVIFVNLRGNFSSFNLHETMKELDINSLSLKYKNWNLKFVKSKEYILIINGFSNGNEDELFDLLKEISASNTHNVSIKLSKTNAINVVVKKRSVGSKYHKMYTSGCFDIFHYGHLNILQKTKELCDYLVVGVSTDELIAKEKGKRPVIPFEERIKLVKAIKYVDEVIPQIDKDKQRVVDDHNIDAISVGDDWRGRFPKTSCPVEYFTYTASVSSTILKDTLQLQKKI